MNKNTKLVMIITACLVVVVAVFAFLNRENIAGKKEAQESGIFFLNAGGEEFTVTMDDIEALSPFLITANYKKSGQDAETRMYRGVSLKSVVERMGVDYSRNASVSFIAADGYASALSITEAMDDSNCFIVIAEGDKPLGTRESGGSGPFMMIMAKDQFSQRWCKFLLEVNLQ